MAMPTSRRILVQVPPTIGPTTVSIIIARTIATTNGASDSPPATNGFGFSSATRSCNDFIASHLLHGRLAEEPAGLEHQDQDQDPEHVDVLELTDPRLVRE